MNVLLINPWIYDFAAYDLWMKPVGLLYVASFLEKFGHNVSLINCLDRYHPLLNHRYRGYLPLTRKYDCGKFFSQEVDKPECLKKVPRKYKRYGITPQIFEEELSRVNPPPDIVGITSGMTYWYPGVFEVIKRVKRRFPQVPVVLGGLYATLCYQHATFYSGADHVVRGRGEIKMLQILDEIEGIKRDYSLQKDVEIFPAYHLLPVVRSVAILTSRGCPFSCTYCASPLLEPNFIQRTPESIIREISHYLQKFKVQDIAFYDDALLVKAKEHIVPLLGKIVENFKGIRFHTPNGLHIKYIDQSIACLFYQANFKTLRLSFESTSPQIQKNSSGKVTNQDLVRATDHLKKAGFKPREIEVYIMIGFPGQKMKEVLETIRFVHKVGVKIKIAEYSPIPGTFAFSQAVKQCSLIEEEPLLHNNSVFPLWGKEINYHQVEEIKKVVQELNSKLPAD